MDDLKDGVIENPFEKAYKGFILGSKEFIERIKKKYRPILSHPDMPQTKYLQKEKPTVQEVLEKLCTFFRLEQSQLTAPWGQEKRACAIYLTRALTDASLKEIASVFGGVKPSAITMVVKRVEEKRSKNSLWNVEIKKVEKALYEMLNVKT